MTDSKPWRSDPVTALKNRYFDHIFVTVVKIKLTDVLRTKSSSSAPKLVQISRSVLTMLAIKEKQWPFWPPCIRYIVCIWTKQVVSIIRIETICGPPQLPSFHNSFPVIRTANAKIAVFTYRSAHFCFPWRRPCDYHAMRCMDGKAIQCLPNPSQHVAIYLQ